MAWAKGNNECFLLLPLDQLRAEMRHLCEPIVKSRYPKLVEKGKRDKKANKFNFNYLII
jgi:hypothetical protein